MSTLSTSASRFSTPSIVLHWLMAVMLVGLVVAIELHEAFPKGSDMRTLLVRGHFMMGITVFGLVWVRLLMRLLGPTPAIVPAPPVWQDRAGRLVHLVLYALMLALPLVGWLLVNAKGRPVPYFFGLQLPTLIEASRPLAETLEEVHEALAQTGIVLVALHTVAAIYHHHVQKDNTLRRMLPGRN